MARRHLWNTSSKPAEIEAKLRERAPVQAKTYGAMLTHEYLSTEAIVRKLGKDPAKGSDVTTVLGMLKSLREQGLIVSKLKRVAGQRGASLLHKKCDKPLLVPQESPLRRAKKKTTKATTKDASTKGKAKETNGAERGPADPLQVILDAVEALQDAAQQTLRTVRMQADLIARANPNMEEMRDAVKELNKKVAAMQNSMPGRTMRKH